MKLSIIIEIGNLGFGWNRSKHQIERIVISEDI